MTEQDYAIGIDDTDGTLGGCTTHVIFRFLREHPDIHLTDYPRLVRNNPNIPWKTRGNGSLSIHFKASRKDAQEYFEELIRIVKHDAQDEENTNPGLVLFQEPVPSIVRKFAVNALTRVLTIQDAKRISEENALSMFLLKKGRGLIGALSAIGNELLPDYSFELLGYRVKSNWGTQREVDVHSAMELEIHGLGTQFSSYDAREKVALIFPHGPDPVYFGVRGNNPRKLVALVKEHLVLKEPLEGSMLVRSNQGTEQHFWYATETTKPFHVSRVLGIVLNKPKIQQGKHVFFQVRSLMTQQVYDLAIYEPTRELRRIATLLEPEDKIHVFGGIRDPSETPNPGTPTLNVEKLIVLNAKPAQHKITPKCEVCGKTLTSAGKNKGYKCVHCHRKYPEKQTRIKYETRAWLQGIYLPALNAQRHLTKPLSRYGVENHDLEKPKISAPPINPLNVELS